MYNNYAFKYCAHICLTRERIFLGDCNLFLLLHDMNESKRNVNTIDNFFFFIFYIIFFEYQVFILVDDDGKLLAQGTPTGNRVPEHRQRAANWRAVGNGKYSAAALQLGAEQGAGGDEERE